MLQSIDTLYGTLVAPDFANDLITRSIRELGEWGAIESCLAAGLLSTEDSLWDVGAFLGTFSLGVCLDKRPSSVLAIEPNPRVFDALSHNIRLLNCPARVVGGGVSASSGWLSPINENPKNVGATLWEFSKEPPKDANLIPCHTLKELRQEFGDYDFIKLDIEGMELDAIRADFSYLRQRQPTIWAECNESRMSLHLLAAFQKLGYEVLYVAFPAYRTANYRRIANIPFHMAYEAALVAGQPSLLSKLRNYASEKEKGADILCYHVDTPLSLRKALFNTPRWCHMEWINLTRAELVARLGRCQKGIHLDKFMAASELDNL